MKGERKTNFALDNTLRHLINTLWYRRVQFMAIHFVHKGKTYIADTPQEAAELRRLLEHQDADQGVHGMQSRFWTPDQALSLLDSLGEMQQKLLAILARGGSVPSGTIVLALKLDSEIALAGVISGLSKQCRKANLNPHDIYSVSVEWDGKQKERFFRMLDDFRYAIEELGWPEAWEQKKSK